MNFSLVPNENYIHYKLFIKQNNLYNIELWVIKQSLLVIKCNIFKLQIN